MKTPTLSGADWRRQAIVSGTSGPRAAPHVTVQTLASPKLLGDGTNLLHRVTVNGEQVFASTSLRDTLRELRRILAQHRADLA